ncbi:MAG: SMP-30/gluconolactonase/LRE family protein [Pseudomonadota bacterium]
MKTGLSIPLISAALAALCACSTAPMSAEDTAAVRVEVYRDSARVLFRDGAVPTVLATGYQWSEGPLWIGEGDYLLFSDVPSNVIHRYVPGEGAAPWLTPSGATGLAPTDTAQGSNGLVLDPEGRLVLMQHGDRRVARMIAPLGEPAARFETLVGEYDGRRLNSPNDAVYARDGSLYFTDPPYGLAGIMEDPHKALPFQGVYRLAPDRRLTLIDDSRTYPNGVALSRDEKTLYVAVSDEAFPHWARYAVAEDGTVSQPDVFFDARDLPPMPGLPDGMAMHSAGWLFATGPGGVFVFSERGELAARIFTGRLTANCALSADEKTLYLTAHDALMKLDLR